MRVHDLKHNQVYSATVQAIREIIIDQFYSCPKRCYKHLGGDRQSIMFRLSNLKETDTVELWSDKIEIISDDGIKTCIERAC